MVQSGDKKASNKRVNANSQGSKRTAQSSKNAAKKPASKEEIVDNLSQVFRHQGYEGASLKQLSDATGLGRSSLYHHFPNGKEDMACVVLGEVHSWMEENILSVLQDSQKAPLDRLSEAGAKLLDFYDRGNKSCLLELFAIGDSRDQFGDAVKSSLTALSKGFEQVALDAGVDEGHVSLRAEEAIISVQGALVLSRGVADSGPFERTIAKLAENLLRK